jgi:hypothetical protein
MQDLMRCAAMRGVQAFYVRKTQSPLFQCFVLSVRAGSQASRDAPFAQLWRSRHGCR